MTDKEYVLQHYSKAFIHKRSKDKKAYPYHVHNEFEELGKRCPTKLQAWKSARNRIENKLRRISCKVNELSKTKL